MPGEGLGAAGSIGPLTPVWLVFRGATGSTPSRWTKDLPSLDYRPRTRRLGRASELVDLGSMSLRRPGADVMPCVCDMSVNSLTPGVTVPVPEGEPKAWPLAMTCCACGLTVLGAPRGPPEGLASRVELILTDVVMMIGRQLERRLAYDYLLVYR